MSDHLYTNALIDESSPYLQQHAHNPVDWMPWGEAALKKARDENKLMLVSIGYSTCHWCHVMERESFEHEDVAEVMNANFVCIKIDREERPDLDQVYMNAVQIMRRQGGWPLNCFATPEGLPVYGGTYFPKDEWIRVMRQLAELWKDDPEKLMEYGTKVAEGIQIEGALPVVPEGEDYDFSILEETLEGWKKNFDRERGGPNRAPKFPMPVNYSFLLNYGQARGDEDIIAQVKLTLDHMARGGIHDHIGGGFARYSTDADWKAPHFEKMLYDNAQLLALYSEGFGAFGDPEYRVVADGIKMWLRREMKHPDGGYFSALDADSEGVEGKYYTWLRELPDLNSDLQRAFGRIYLTDEGAMWEGRLIPIRKGTFQELAGALDTSVEEWIDEYRHTNEALYRIRENRVRPGLDDKRICSWNAMLATGFVTSARYGGGDEDSEEAKGILRFIEDRLYDHTKGVLRHTVKEGGNPAPDFLEDYAFVIEAYIALYTLEFDENHLQRARELAFTAIDRFYDEQKGVFFFVSHDSSDLIARPVELADNVIPSSNGVMAENLVLLAAYFGNAQFERIALRLVHGVTGALSQHGESYGRWANLYLRLSLGTPELVVAGPDAMKMAGELRDRFIPSISRAAATTKSRLIPFENRLGHKQTQLYICRHRSCQQPANTAAEAIEELRLIYSQL